MIGKLRGKVDAIGESFLVVDVNGVGYEVDVPMSTFYNLPGIVLAFLLAYPWLATPFFTRRGSCSTGSAQSMYSSQWHVGVTPSRCTLNSGKRWLDISTPAACALALSEAHQDLTTLGQLGATPAMTRRLVVAEAWLLATLGALLAAAIGLGPFAVQSLASWQVRPRLAIPASPSPLAVPWTLLVAVSVGIPAFAAAAASLLGRSPAPLAPRRGG